MSVEMFDPTMSPEKEAIQYAPRPEKLDGLKVGLVDNTKYNSRALLIKISERLKDRFGTEMIKISKKQSAGHRVEDSDVEYFKTSADVVIAGIGD